MKILVKFISFIGLGLTLIPAFLVFTGDLSLDSDKIIMFIGTFIWFVSAPSWMNKAEESME
jgi:hypothetical protein